MQNNDDVIEKISRNSKALWGVFGVLSMLGIFVFRVSSYIYDTKDLPPRVKQVERDVEKLKSIPDKFSSLESRTSSLELLVAAMSAKQDQAYLQIQQDLTIIKTKITEAGLQHR